MRLHACSAALDGAAAQPGRDLVLRLREQDAFRLARGTVADDALLYADRVRAEKAAADVLGRWRAHYERTLTLDDVPLARIFEFVFAHFVLVPTVRLAYGLKRSLQEHQPAAVEVMDAEPYLLDVVAAVASAVGVEVRALGGTGVAPSRRQPLLRGKTGALLSRIPDAVPTATRSGAVVIPGHWTTAPLADGLLRRGSPRPAVDLRWRMPSPRRSLSVALAGGWVGGAGPRLHARALAKVERALAIEPPRLSALGMDLGPALHRGLQAQTEWLAHELARVQVVRGRWRRRPPSLIVVPWDAMPQARALIVAGREHDVGSLAIAHGGYWIDAIIGDLEFADEVAAWSGHGLAVARTGGRPSHVVGYPGVRSPSPPPRADGCSTVVVPEQVATPITVLKSVRTAVDHYLTAVRAVRRADPTARIVLRPHPSSAASVVQQVVARFPDVDIRVDSATPLVDLMTTADLCVGALSTATLEAAVGGAPVVALDLTGHDWPAPLGGDSDVPVARDADSLADWVARALSGGDVPGRRELLDALGVGAVPDPLLARVELVARLAGRPQRGRAAAAP